MAGGRPPKYGPEMAEKARAYFEDPKATFDMPIPSIGGLACFLGVARDTIYAWRDEHEEFSDILKQGASWQEVHFSRRLADKDVATAGLIFTAKNVAGWRDKQEIEHTGKDGGPIVLWGGGKSE